MAISTGSAKMMPKRPLVMALLYHLPGMADDRIGDGLEMLDLWIRHLRGPGEYHGEVALVTNIDVGNVDGLTTISPSHCCDSIADIQLLKAVSLCSADLSCFDSVLYLDLDILGVGSLAPLFANDESLWAARSSIPLLDKRHAGSRLNVLLRTCGRLLPLGRSVAANTCAVSFCPRHRESTIDRYAALVSDARESNLTLPLGDQTVFNWGIWTKSIPAKLYPATWIQHSQWSAGADRVLWHFPAADRLNVMKSHAII